MEQNGCFLSKHRFAHMPNRRIFSEQIFLKEYTTMDFEKKTIVPLFFIGFCVASIPYLVRNFAQRLETLLFSFDVDTGLTYTVTRDPIMFITQK